MIYVEMKLPEGKPIQERVDMKLQERIVPFKEQLDQLEPIEITYLKNHDLKNAASRIGESVPESKFAAAFSGARKGAFEAALRDPSVLQISEDEIKGMDLPPDRIERVKGIAPHLRDYIRIFMLSRKFINSVVGDDQKKQEAVLKKLKSEHIPLAALTTFNSSMLRIDGKESDEEVTIDGIEALVIGNLLDNARKEGKEFGNGSKRRRSITDYFRTGQGNEITVSNFSDVNFVPDDRAKKAYLKEGHGGLFLAHLFATAGGKDLSHSSQRVPEGGTNGVLYQINATLK